MLEFHKNNRQKLKNNIDSDLIIVAGNSLIQASADRTFPFQQDSNFRYLTGIVDPGIILVINQAEEYLIVPKRTQSRVAFEGNINLTKLTETSGINEIVNSDEGWEKLENSLSKTDKVATLTPSSHHYPEMDMFTQPTRKWLSDKIHEVNNLIEFEDIRPAMSQMRMIKEQFEVDCINDAINSTFKLYQAIQDVIPKATYEYELHAEVEKVRVLERLNHAYEPIIASGQNAITLHYEHNKSKIDKSGMLLLDIGLSKNGYAADITRTISFKPTKRQQAVFNAVLEVHAYALKILKPGVLVKEYEKLVRQFMKKQLRALGLDAEQDRKYYPHATSHFLGLDVHDAADYELPLAENMILTVEPGIFIPEENIGIRLEDDVLITKNGNKVLTSSLPKSISSLTIAS